MNDRTLKPPTIDLRQAIKTGAIGGLVAMFVGATGMIEKFSSHMVIEPFLTMGYMLFLAIPLLIGYLAARPPVKIEGLPDPVIDRQNIIAGTLAGLTSGLVLALFLWGLQLFDAKSVRDIFLNISDDMYALLTFNQGLNVGTFWMIGVFTVLGFIGGAFHLLPDKLAHSLTRTAVSVLSLGLLSDVFGQISRQIKLEALVTPLINSRGGLTLLGAIIMGVLVFGLTWFMQTRGTAVTNRISQLPEAHQRQVTAGYYLLLAILVLILPRILGNFLSEVLDLVGIFAIMGLGLNIVLGYAGMLDLGYVAFFAVGAYMTAILTSSTTPGCVAQTFCPQISFWFALPICMIAAAIAGAIVGAPVIRMRGDYLAIVTLGFGEIARVLIISDWFKPVLGGAQGILNIPDVHIGSTPLTTSVQFYYPIVGFVILSIYALWRLQSSRPGRAWMALREDERVAEVMGINIVSTKLSAFITGAILASFSGALFASKIGSIFPSSFEIEKSIQVLIIVIVGGLGSIPGMLAGSFLIVGMPEILREFDEYRFMAYGILLIVMMLYRPEGLIPRKRAAENISDEERSQDAWLKDPKTQKPTTTPKKKGG